MNNVLVLCIGNICRSPMAEALLRKALPGVNVYSAGIGALIGHSADPIAVQIMSDQGCDIAAHRAQKVSRNLVAEADLILVMDLEQKRFMEERYPNARGKVFRLCENKKEDVPDPYRLGIEEFHKAYYLISSGVQFWVEQIAQI